MAYPRKGGGGHSYNPAQDLVGQMSNLKMRDAPFPEDIKQALGLLKQYAGQLMGKGCRNCKHGLLAKFNPVQHVGHFFEASRRGVAVISSVKCAKCSTATCMGCGSKPVTSGNTARVKDMRMGWCCDDGRLASIWLLLCHFDAGKLFSEKVHSVKSAKQPANKYGSTAGGGVGYAQPRGVTGTDGFFNDEWGMKAKSADKAIRLKSADKDTDKRNEETMLLLKELVPKLRTAQSPPFEVSPPPVIGAMFKLSLLAELVVDLVRNDSIGDAATRLGVYTAALDLTNTLCRRSVTLPIVVEERHVKKRTGGILSLTNDGGASLQLGPESDGKNSSVAEAMKPITIVAETMKSGAKLDPGAYRDEKALLTLCDRVIAVADNVIPMIKKSNDESTPAAQWKKYHDKKMLTWVDDSVMMNSHWYRNKAEFHQPVKPARMKRLIEEIAELRTSLPEGIFVKVADSRPDFIKVLIQGPDGTPYAHGLFEFDVLCPARYPQEPPLVWFPIASRHGKSINPNLHPDGKVCLSLINTWPGQASEQWQPNLSKLISVFVSIQSMIFNEKPWENSPVAVPHMDLFPQQAMLGHSMVAMEFQISTVAFGMLAWLTDASMTGGMWADVLRNYFGYNASSILKTVHEWSRNNPRMTAATDVAFSRLWQRHSAFTGRSNLNLVKELERALQPYLKH